VFFKQQGSREGLSDEDVQGGGIVGIKVTWSLPSSKENPETLDNVFRSVECGRKNLLREGLPGVPSSPWEIIEGCELLGKEQHRTQCPSTNNHSHAKTTL